MRDDLLYRVADVLEKTAAYIDGIESEKTAAETARREATLQDVASKYTQATGETLESSELSKLAADASALETVQKLLIKTSGSLESLGRPGKQAASPVPLTKAAARQAAYDRFAAFLSD
jgi:hypothetical protein